MSLIYFILTGILLYVLLIYGGRILKSLAKKHAIKWDVLRMSPLVELGAWLAYTFWGIRLIFGDLRFFDQLTILMAALLIAGIAWFVFRDFFAGMMLKMEYKLHPGQYIKTPTTEGQIVSLGNRFIELENENGERTFIPFSRFTNEWLSIPGDQEKRLSHRMVIKLEHAVNASRFKLLLQKEMMTMPWIIGPAPVIKLSQDKERIVDIRFHLLKEEHALVVEEKLRSRIAQICEEESPDK
jgi:small-conductance mechanosensitive channel